MTFSTIRKKTLLASAAATTLGLMMSTSAMAQDAEPELVEDEVVATGIRQSIANSLNLKKENTSIVEAISAEDIGKLPDVSIADSLARLPGVTAQRVRGRAQQISIRGLGPDFSLALLNGREQVSSGNNRGIEFDQYPSELIAQGIVYKSPDARLAATGIAGAVDLRTVRPLDYTERKVNASGQYVINDSGSLNPDFSDDGYRLFGSYIDQLADGRVGISLGITHQSNPTQFTSRELKTNAGQTSSTEAGGGLIYPSDNPRTGVVSRDFERTSVAGTLQFEPNDRFQATVDSFYTDSNDSGIFRGTETPIASWSGAQLDSVSGSGIFADSATYSAVVPIVRTDTEGAESDIFSFGVNTSYQVSDRLKVTGDYAFSTLDRSNIDYESYAGTGPARSGAQDVQTFTFPEDGDYSIQSQLDYTDPGTVLLTDPGGWGQVGFLRNTDVEDELTQIRLEAEYEMDTPFISGLVAGFLQTDREKIFDDNPFFLRESERFNNGSLAIPSEAIIGQTDSGSIGQDLIAYDPSSFLTDGTYFVQDCETVPGCVETEWTVDENISTFYGMANIDALLGNLPLRGNVGFQYVDTKVNSTGTLAGIGIQTVEDKYDDFLPSLNLSLEVADDTFIRGAVAKTLTRARLDQLAANQSFNRNALVCPDTDSDGVPDDIVPQDSPQQTCFGLGGGNPFLKPYESTQYDLSFEKYFGEATAVAVALFRKDLSNWVLDRTILVDGTPFYQAAGLGSFVANNPQVAPTRLDGPVNFADGFIQGIELTARVSLDDILPDTLTGFGFSGSYTYSDNGLNDESGNQITIPGQSKDIWSADVYYENYGFRAKLSARHRSGFLSEVLNFDGTLSGASATSETILDAQIGYEWDQGPLEGFSINLEAYNLTDEPFRTQNDLFYDSPTGDVAAGETFISRHEQYGTTYNITIAKKF